MTTPNRFSASKIHCKVLGCEKMVQVIGYGTGFSNDNWLENVGMDQNGSIS